MVVELCVVVFYDVVVDVYFNCVFGEDGVEYKVFFDVIRGRIRREYVVERGE